MKPVLRLLLLAGAVSATLAQGDAPSRPPATRVESVTDRLHGVEITDPYRWLEGDNSEPARMGRMTDEVAAWTDAQNAHTRAILDALPGRRELEDRMRPLLEIDSVSAPVVRGDRYFFSRRRGSENQPVWYWREGARGETRTLLDPAQLDPSGLTVVTWISPDENGERVAYGTYRAGDENTTLRLLEVVSGRTLDLSIPNKVQSARLASGRLGIRLPESRGPEGSVHGAGAVPPHGRRPGARRGALPPVHARGEREARHDLGPDRARSAATAAGSCSATGRAPTRTTSGWWTSSSGGGPASS